MSCVEKAMPLPKCSDIDRDQVGQRSSAYRSVGALAKVTQQEVLGQYPTPGWVAQALFERHFSHCRADEVFCEPSCGPGSFLSVIPTKYKAFGVELDPRLAEVAREQSGRPVITGDFRSVDLDGAVGCRPTVFIGNPPFQMSLIDGFLERIYSVLQEGGRAGFVLPAYAFQTAARVAGYSKRWTLISEMIPRNIYPGLRFPLVFALFIRERVRRLIGFALYQEATDVLSMEPAARQALTKPVGGVWASAVGEALSALGGSAGLAQIYQWFQSRRPTDTTWWKEKIRQTLARHPKQFQILVPGTYALLA